MVQSALDAPLHSNLILTGEQDIDLVTQVDTHLNSTWSIKDASGTLDLTTFGFEILFKANWFVRPPMAIPSTGTVSRAKSEEAFVQWVESWKEAPEVFKTQIWQDPKASFYHDDDWQGGIATNLSSDAIGITNPWGTKAAINACIQEVAYRHPDLPIVGYDHTPDIEAMAELGFESTAPLAIWLKEAA